METKNYFIKGVRPKEYTEICNQKDLLSKRLKKFNLDGRSFSFKYVQEKKLVGVFAKSEGRKDFLILSSKHLRNNLERKFVDEMLILFKKKLNKIRNNSR